MGCPHDPDGCVPCHKCTEHQQKKAIRKKKDSLPEGDRRKKEYQKLLNDSCHRPHEKSGPWLDGEVLSRVEEMFGEELNAPREERRRIRLLRGFTRTY